MARRTSPPKTWRWPIVVIGIAALILIAVTIGFPLLRTALATIHGLFVPPA
jgi:hypothetical protein